MIRLFKKSLFLSFLLVFSLCNGQNVTIKKSTATDAKTSEKQLDEMHAVAILGTAFQTLLDVPDMSKYSSSTTRENYKQPDEYFVVNFQEKGNIFYIGYIYPDARLKYLLKMDPLISSKDPEIKPGEATKIAEKFVVERLNAKPTHYKVTKTEKEKASKGILAYYKVDLERQDVSKAGPKVVRHLIIKVHPRSKEIMSMECFY